MCNVQVKCKEFIELNGHVNVLQVKFIVKNSYDSQSSS